MSTNYTEVSDSDQEGVAIVGMAGKFPGASDLEAYWSNLCGSVEGISFYTDEELKDKGVPDSTLNSSSFVKASPDIDGIDLFDAGFFGYSPSAAKIIDPQQRLFLEHSWHALEDAGYDPEQFDGKIGVYASSSLSTYLLFNILANPQYSDIGNEFPIMLGNDKDYIASRVAYHLGLEGPSMTVQSACSSSMTAIHLACETLLSFQADMMIAGGVSVGVPQRSGYHYTEGGISSPDGHCRAFDDSSEGTLFGSGVGVVVLKRLQDALSSGDSIVAVITGSALTNDGSRKVGYTAPSINGQRDAVVQALTIGDSDPATLAYVEAHGTGTSLGDMIEVTALTQGFREGSGTLPNQYCALGSVKSNIGHLDAAAGIAGFIKTALAVKSGQIPPTLHFETPNSNIDFENSPFYVNSTLLEWPSALSPRRAGINSTGIGGVNVHAVLEQAPEISNNNQEPREEYLLFPFSASTPEALHDIFNNMDNWADTRGSRLLADASYTCKVGRARLPHRSFSVVKNTEHGTSIFTGNRKSTVHEDHKSKKAVFVYPGAGNDYQGMCKDLYTHNSIFRDALDECSSILFSDIGFDITDYIYPELASNMTSVRDNHPELALPATFIIEYALTRVLKNHGIVPSAMIGHSFGEYCAACESGVMSLSDALGIVLYRSKLFEELPEGRMLSVFCSIDQLNDLVGGAISVAAINSSNYCVLSGSVDDIEVIESQLASRQIESKSIRINFAAHSKDIDQIIPKFRQFVSNITLSAPTTPFISNVTGTWIKTSEAMDAEYWCTHLRNTVRFKDGINELNHNNDVLFIEVGPGNSLSRFVRDELSSESNHPFLNTVRHVQDDTNDIEHLLIKMGEYWACGGKLNWNAAYSNELQRRISLPGYPFQRKRYWVNPNPVEKNTKPQVEQSVGGKQKNINDWFNTVIWSQKPPTDIKTAQKEIWLIFYESRDQLDALTIETKKSGIDIVEVYCTNEETDNPLIVVNDVAFNLSMGDPRHYVSLFEKLDQMKISIDRVISLLPMIPRSSFESAKLRHYTMPVLLVQAMDVYYSDRSVVFAALCCGMFKVESQDKVNPDCGLSMAVNKVLPQEFDWLTCVCIDLASPQVTHVNYLLSDILQVPLNREVAYRGKIRYLPIYNKYIPRARSVPLADSVQTKTVVVIGGTGKVGMYLAAYFAKNRIDNIVLIGKSEFPDREDWEDLANSQHQKSKSIRKLLELEKLGSNIIVRAASIQDTQSMESLVCDIESGLGNITGFVHAAGVAGVDAFCITQDIDTSLNEPQFQSKIYGTKVLADVVQKRQPEFVALVSSSVSVFGGTGLLAYTAANSYLDSFAQYMASDQETWWSVLNLDWISRDEQSPAHTIIDDYAISEEESYAVFEEYFSQRETDRLLISTGNFNDRLNHWIHLAGDRKSRRKNKVKNDATSVPLSSPDAGCESELEKTIHKTWCEVLGTDSIYIDDNFFSVGGDSLLAVSIRGKLTSEIGIDIPIAVLYHGLTIRTLAEQIDKLSNSNNTEEKNSDRASEELRDRRKKLIELQRSRQATLEN